MGGWLFFRINWIFPLTINYEKEIGDGVFWDDFAASAAYI
jgi:hypothetical protein